MHLAVEKNNVEIVKLLLKHENIDISIKDDIQYNKIKSSFCYFYFNDFFFDNFWRKPIDCALNEEIKQLFNHWF